MAVDIGKTGKTKKLTERVERSAANEVADASTQVGKEETFSTCYHAFVIVRCFVRAKREDESSIASGLTVTVARQCGISPHFTCTAKMYFSVCPEIY